MGGSKELRQCAGDCIFWNKDELDLNKSSFKVTTSLLNPHLWARFKKVTYVIRFTLSLSLSLSHYPSYYVHTGCPFTKSGLCLWLYLQKKWCKYRRRKCIFTSVTGTESADRQVWSVGDISFVLAPLIVIHVTVTAMFWFAAWPGLSTSAHHCRCTIDITQQTALRSSSTYHQTHYRSYQGRVFMGQMTQPTSAFFVKEYFPVRYAYFVFWLEASVQYLYVTTSVVSLLTIHKLGLLNNQQAIEIWHLG